MARQAEHSRVKTICTKYGELPQLHNVKVLWGFKEKGTCEVMEASALDSARVSDKEAVLIGSSRSL